MIKRALLVLAVAMASQLDAQQKKFDATNFIVLGEGLAAGMADYSLKDIYQLKCFPARMATQMNTSFPQALFQGSGIGNAPGFPEMPVRVPGPGPRCSWASATLLLPSDSLCENQNITLPPNGPLEPAQFVRGDFTLQRFPLHPRGSSLSPGSGRVAGYSG